MRDLSTVRGQLPDIQQNDVQALLLNIHETPGRDLLSRFDFVFSPTYLIFDSEGEELFRSNELPTVEDILDITNAG